MCNFKLRRACKNLHVITDNWCDIIGEENVPVSSFLLVRVGLGFVQNIHQFKWRSVEFQRSAVGLCEFSVADMKLILSKWVIKEHSGNIRTGTKILSDLKCDEMLSSTYHEYQETNVLWTIFFVRNKSLKSPKFCFPFAVGSDNGSVGNSFLLVWATLRNISLVSFIFPFNMR